MTEQNYVDPGQNQPALAEQMRTLLVRIDQLEFEVLLLREQFAHAERGQIITYSS